MSISILLPYKENFSPAYPGAVSIFIKDTVLKSKYKKKITIYGNTNYKTKFLKNYINLPLNKNFLQSGSKIYIKNFLKKFKNNKTNIIEVHNRPNYIKNLSNLDNVKIVLYFHNDPLEMQGSTTLTERIFLLENLEKIIFNSQWSKKRFLKNLNAKYLRSEKLIVVEQSTSKVSVNISQKENTIVFVGKHNKAKGYDLFGEVITKILDKYPEWNSLVIGDEPREKIIIEHERLKNLGFQKHNIVLKKLQKSSIAVVCSRWNEPFGRTSLEAASRGCAVIISNKGGLPETITDGITLKNLSIKTIYNSIEKLIKNKKLRKKLQNNSLKNFYLTNEFISKKIDNYRDEILSEDIISYKLKKNIKILHITNFNERHDGRLFYNTGRRINNGFIRLNHSVQTISDRDIISNNRSIIDPYGSKKLNKKIINNVSIYKPDLIVLGHADLVSKETLIFIKKKYPHTKIVQWFLDRMDSEWSFNKKRFLDKIDFMDVNFCTTDPKVLKFPKKYNIKFIPNPADESFENLEIYNNINFKYDVFFALSHGVHRGTLKKGKFDAREIFINKLIKLTPGIKYHLFGIDGNQPIWAEEFKKEASKARMGLNISQGKPLKYYSSDRITQLLGNGMLTFIDKKTRLNNFFSNKEVIFYNSLNDLSKKIIKYSKNEKLSKQISINGKKKYLKYFNSTIVAEYIVSKGINRKSSNKFIWDK
tara:strand:- start:1489 stop:3600 length:2112 start_codon:yes stop_codon:yes gene_type:complete